MIKEAINQVSGIEWLGMISLLLFFVTFIIALVWTLRMKTSHVNRMKQLPLEDGNTPHRQGDA
jgi:hypothetical protein